MKIEKSSKLRIMYVLVKEKLFEILPVIKLVIFPAIIALTAYFVIVLDRVGANMLKQP